MVRGLFLALAMTSPALAETPAPVTRAPDGNLLIASPPCSSLIKGADYVAGVDANGKPVAPADLPSEASPVRADSVSIEISARFAPNLLQTGFIRRRAQPRHESDHTHGLRCHTRRGLPNRASGQGRVYCFRSS